MYLSTQPTNSGSNAVQGLNAIQGVDITQDQCFLVDALHHTLQSYTFTILHIYNHTMKDVNAKMHVSRAWISNHPILQCNYLYMPYITAFCSCALK